jgi:hypothetical protein
MVISEFFKLLNLNKKIKKIICTDEIGQVKMKKNEKKKIIIKKNLFSIVFSFSCSFGLAFQS